MTTPNEAVGVRVYAARKNAQMSQAQVARDMQAAGFDYFRAITMVRIEKGQRGVFLLEAFPLSRILNVDLETLAGLEAWNPDTELQELRAFKRRIDEAYGIDS